MKWFLRACLLSAFAAPVFAGDIGVTVTVGQPGFYGQINIGNVPRPPVFYEQPVVIHPSAVLVAPAPIYLHVPPGHEKHWRKHCAEYNACGVPVYFVRDDWYNNEYVPHYHHNENGDHDGEHGHGQGRHKEHGHGDD
jgi:hypothetical protein